MEHDDGHPAALACQEVRGPFIGWGYLPDIFNLVSARAILTRVFTAGFVPNWWNKRQPDGDGGCSSGVDCGIDPSAPA